MLVKIPETSQALGYVRRLDTSKKQQLNENDKEIQVIKDKSDANLYLKRKTIEH